MAPRPPRPNDKGGRPSPIDDPIAYNQDGTPISVAQRIVDRVRVMGYLEPAIASTGVGKPTVYGWLRVAGKAQLRNQGRDLTKAKLTPHERKCIEFSTALDQASNEWHLNTLAQLEQIGRGGITNEVVTVKVERTPVGTDEDGNTRYAMVEVERSTRTTHTLPNAQVLIWRLRHRFPELYREHIGVELRDDRGELTEEERAAELIVGFENYLADVDAAASLRKQSTNGKRAD